MSSTSAATLPRVMLAKQHILRLNSTASTPQYAADPSQGPMLQYQAALPHLPVPTLEHSAAMYLRSVKPIVSEVEYANTEKLVKEFIAPGGVGEKLQQRLQNRAKSTENWMYEWWNVDAYMGYREPVVPYVSYFFGLRDDKLATSTANRAAKIITAALEFKRLVDSKTLEPEYMRKLPICMDAYKNLFNTCRMPFKPADLWQTYDAAVHKHFIVIRKNRFYKVLHEANGKQLSTAELQSQLEKIYEATATLTDAPGIGVLTGTNRDTWTDTRPLLLEADSSNGVALEEIQSASFVVCLDEAAPVTLEERAHQWWHGNGTNRFFDKPAQLLIADNGSAGFTGEHSMMDGTTTHRMCDFIGAAIAKNSVPFETEVRSVLPEPTELKFVVNEAITEKIAAAQAEFDRNIAMHEVAVWNWQGYGKGLIKKFKCSPDGYMQMLLQLAYYKCFGVSRPTYESAATRKFILGRTETCRSVSVESVDFCKTMQNPKATPAEKVAAARAAIKSQGSYIAQASDGQGVDRHWYGLKKSLLPGEPVPEMFKDPVFSYSSSWFLSTSQLSSEYFNAYGWSEVIDQGFGLAYMVNENWLNVNVCSKHLGSEKMRYYLSEAAQDLADAFRSELEPAAKL